MKRTNATNRLPLIAVLALITLLPLLPIAEEAEASLALPTGETAPYTKKLQEQWVLCLPITLSPEGLNESLFLQSGQGELTYDKERLQYLGTSEQLLNEYACTYTDPAAGQTVKQGWVINGTEAGFVRMAFASPYGCKVEGAMLELCFAFTEKALPGDSLEFSLNSPLFTFTDREQNTVKGNASPCTGSLQLSAQADRSALQAAYDSRYAAVYTEGGEPAVAMGDTKDLTEGSLYLSSADMKTDAAALSAAHRVLNKADADQEELDAALKALERDFVFPRPHALSYGELEGKIEIAKEKVESSEFSSYSLQLQKKWKTALENAQALLREEARPTNTQRKLDNAAKAITELVKTGEDGWIFLLPAIMLLCAAGLAVVLKKRKEECLRQ